MYLELWISFVQPTPSSTRKSWKRVTKKRLVMVHWPDVNLTKPLLKISILHYSTYVCIPLHDDGQVACLLRPSLVYTLVSSFRYRTVRTLREDVDKCQRREEPHSPPWLNNWSADACLIMAWVLFFRDLLMLCRKVSLESRTFALGSVVLSSNSLFRIIRT